MMNDLKELAFMLVVLMFHVMGWVMTLLVMFSPLILLGSILYVLFR
jgi:hypothetical protein